MDAVVVCTKHRGVFFGYVTITFLINLLFFNHAMPSLLTMHPAKIYIVFSTLVIRFQKIKKSSFEQEIRQFLDNFKSC